MPFKISDIGEKELIRRLLEKTKKSTTKSPFLDDLSLKSLSDDAALLDLKKHYLVATSDMLIRSAHFPEEMTYNQIGKKTATANVSDLAAMGAKPVGFLVAMGLPAFMKIDDFDKMIDGILKACSYYEMPLIGGDINESSELTLCGTCLGLIEKGNVLMKSGAQIGDVVAVTGPLGLAAAGFEVLFAAESKLKGLDPKVRSCVLKHALEPKARSKEGVLLAKTGFVNSATDITDGLVSEIGEIVDASNSGIGITIYEDMLPIPKEVTEVAHAVRKDPLELALYYGEDFELLLTMKKDSFDKLKRRIKLYKIGDVTSSGRIEMINKEGSTNIITARGYQHLGKYHEKRSSFV